MADDPLFGVHGQALALRAQRMALLASNIANAATPGYKARDIDFQKALADASSGQSADQAAQNLNHSIVKLAAACRCRVRSTATPSSSRPSRPPSPRTRSLIAPRSPSSSPASTR